MTFDEFIVRVDKFYYDHEFELRYGQSLMNILYQVHPDLYKKITQTDLDCFYDDGTVRYTLEYLEKKWDDKNI